MFVRDDLDSLPFHRSNREEHDFVITGGTVVYRQSSVATR